MPDPFIEVSDRTGYRSLGADASEGYRAANIDLIRVHDNYGPGDIYDNFQGTHEMADGTIFQDATRNRLVMFPDLGADPTRPDSYNFGPTDQLLAAIDAIGAAPLFRLGESAGASSGVPNDFESDEDFERYATIAKHVVLHYTQGWNDGFHYQIKYWEVLNEPDGRFEADKYYRLYAAIARAVKEADPEARIGGPALMFAFAGTGYEDDFLEYLRANDVPLDFWTFHDYCVDAADPYLYVRVAEKQREMLDRYGFTDTELIISEWNVLGFDLGLLTLGARAAFTACAIIYMQDSPIDEQTFYMGPNLFGEDGSTPNKVGQALTAVGRLKHTPNRLTVVGDDTYGFAVQAGRSDDGNTMTIVVSNYEVPATLRGPRRGGDVIDAGEHGTIHLLPRRDLDYSDNEGFTLLLTGLEEDADFRIERYRTDDVWDGRLLSTVRERGANMTVSGRLPAPGIETIIITRVS